MAESGREGSVERQFKPAWFHVLVAVAAGHRHGYAIRQEVERRTEGRVRLWPATLYGTLSELVKVGLLREDGGEVPPEGDDARRRYYGFTEAGRTALESETRRLEDLVRAARASLVHEAGG